MERIKEALEKAREQREHGALRTGEPPAAGSRLGADRILEHEPFRDYSSAEQRKVLETGRVIDVGAGETIQFAGDRDAYVHYLLSGAVVVRSDQGAKTLTADETAACLPLDAAGVKSHTITAASDVEVFRVPFSSLPGGIDMEDETPLPPAAYTETYSGQQLADLVRQINDEHEELDRNGTRASVVDPQVLLGDEPAGGVGELSSSVEGLLADLELIREEETFAQPEPGYAPRVDDELGHFTRDLEVRFRRYVDKVKKDERTRYEAQLHKHARHLQQLAEQQIRKNMSTLRERYQTAYEEKERRLRDRYNNLRGFANKIARQKAAIYVARQQIGEKLRLVEQVHTELSQLGRQLNDQLDDLDELMPDGALQQSTGTDPV